jgi:hypothetical protein
MRPPDKCRTFLPIIISVTLFVALPVLAQVFQILKVAQTAKLYPDPDLDSPVLGEALKGAEAAVLKKLGDWYKVKVGELTGWLPRGALHDGSKLLHGEPVQERKSDDVLIGVYGKKTDPPGTVKKPGEMKPGEGPMCSKSSTDPSRLPSPVVRFLLFKRLLDTLSSACMTAPPSLRMEVRKPLQAMYRDPDDTGTPLLQVPLGEQVEIFKNVGDWFKARYQEKTGWMPVKAFEE